MLLPAGFIAGSATDVVDPEDLLGDLYQPFVSLAVGVILFEAGLRLSFGEIGLGAHTVVVRLVAVGVVVTGFGVAATLMLLVAGMSNDVALLIGAILVVSGPTVVLPLLAFIRPGRSVRSALKWEGVLVDPVGALLGVFVFHAVSSGWRLGEFPLSVAVGAAIGLTGTAVLLVLLREVHVNQPRMAVLATLMVVVATVVASDLLREDSGFAAATLMGIGLANQRWVEPSRRIDVSLTREFQETLVQLLIGVLFVLIAASVSPSSVEAVLPEAIVLVLVMVLVLRPLVALLATWRSSLTWRERGFVAWMAPRGIVAGATASAFGLELQDEGVADAELVLPIVFVVIFATVVLYGLTAPLVARRLGVAGKQRGLVLVVGGHDWARELALALQRSGVAVRMWVGQRDDQAAARAAGLEADHGRLMVDAVERETELEEITDALLLTRSDDFNALAAAELRPELGHGHVYRVAPDPAAADLLPPAGEGGILGSRDLTFAEVSRRFGTGARFVSMPAERARARRRRAGRAPLRRLPSGRLRLAVDGVLPPVAAGDTVICLAPPVSEPDSGPG